MTPALAAADDRGLPLVFLEGSPDKDALLVGTGRRVPTDAEKAALGAQAARLPLALG